MEKYGQYRDKGSGIAPFFPISAQASGVYLPFHIFLFVCRVPLLIAVSVTYFLLFSWLAVGSLIKKAALWCLLGIPGVWWVDIQIDGVKRGSLAKHQNRLPQPGTLIASSFTSPIDCLYLAAIFDPIFTSSYPNNRLVERISLYTAILRALSPPKLTPSPTARLLPLHQLLSENPDSAIVVLPECTATNGRGILPFSPSLLTAPAKTKIFPVSLRYTPADITTPIPGAYISFLWNLCSRPTHCIRVRIADAVYNTAASSSRPNGTKSPLSKKPNSYETNFFDGMNIGDSLSDADTLVDNIDGDNLTQEEMKVLDRIADDLARLGRVKRVGLGVKEKDDFLKAWKKTRKVI
ncbi:hypothetical protein EJ08DRAFT_616400 [Tothia fuscella]|uniref:Phospholipid/glycerol acyltransferase domain-containing protein n=1 Tax=Tothia fuscella TaxID=1048955 RepID=A0A9P4NLK9_9PEZI|nr:hypothetical protein EJ08DRAFT_616400 [Tothia fuscella]